MGSVQYDSFQIRRKSNITGLKGKPILVAPKKRTTTAHTIVLDGKDVTPRCLDPNIFVGGKERQISVYDITYGGHEKDSDAASFIFKSQSTVRFKQTEYDKLTAGSPFKTSTNFSYGPSTSPLYSETFSDAEDDSNTDIDTEVDQDFIIVLSDMKYPEHVSLVLSETGTFFLLDIPSVTAEKDTDEGIEVEEMNEEYEYLTHGKGRNRKTLNAEVQTVPITMKTRSTHYPKPKMKAGIAYASEWDMYDTYQKEMNISSSDDEASEKSYDVEHHQLEDTPSYDSYRMSVDERQMLKLVKNPGFQEAACVIERLLANNCYNEQQKIFRGLSVQDDFREKIEYNYKLNLLWTFANDSTKGRSVNSIHWNPANQDIVAVGYGKFYFTDSIPGLILIWNIKNPVQPERSYSFTDSVTSVCFSTKNPMLLAVGFYQGSVIVMNIVSREKLIIGENIPTFETCWDVAWHFGRNERQNEELVVASFDDGRICSYSVHGKLEAHHLMRVAKADGRLKGYDIMRKCANLSMPVSRYATAYFNRPHPVNKSYYFVGTDEGVIHKCSLNYLNRHLDLFLAHDGCIHEMKFCPFSNKIFATCGDDWHTRIWAEGIPEPLFELFVSMQSIQGLDWSPTHSTILVDIRGSFIEIWDMQRKVYAPQSLTENPQGARNTVVQFTKSGKSLIVGDINGNVHVFSLEDMPFPPFFQENLLFESLYRGLLTEPLKVSKLKKIRWQPYADCH